MFEVLFISTYGLLNVYNKKIRANTKKRFNEEFNAVIKEIPFSNWECRIIPEKQLNNDEKKIVSDHKRSCYLA